jgi:cytochrome c1
MRWWRRRERKLAEEQSLRMVFFVSSMLFVLVTGWAIWNEAATRRPWKQFQLEFNRLEYQQVSEQLEKERTVFAGPEVQAAVAKLRAELASAQERLAGPEYTKAERALARVQREHEDANLRSQFIKSELDEALYWVEHAVYQQRDTTKPKAAVEQLERRLHEMAPRVEALARSLEEAEAEVKRFRADVDAIEAKLEELAAPVAVLERRLSAIRSRAPEIKQVVIHGLAVNEFKEPILTVDRCMTCHLGIDRAEFENAPQPYRTHPHREMLFGKHPLTQFGCTSCHQGQGPAIEVDDAHGEVKYWDFPMLRGDVVQASCRTCHVDEKAIALAPVYSRGRDMVEDLGCFGCHNLPGFEKTPKVGPDLTRIAQKVDASWLVRWVKDPKAYLPKTKMPSFGLSDEDALNVTAYLLSASQAMPELRGAHRGGGSVERGREIVSAVGCLGCHRIAELQARAASPVAAAADAGAAAPPGGPVVPVPSRNGKRGALLGPPAPPEDWDHAPDLTRIASKVDAAWLFAWVKNPKHFRPTTRMPDLRLSDEEARAVTAYLMTLGEKQRIPGIDEEVKKAARIAAGERLVRKRGCFGCHDIKGFETAEKIAPDLSNFGHKRLLELFFGEAVQVKQTWEDFTFWKLKDPQIYATERVEQLMPNFGFTDEQAKTLRVFLKSLSTDRVHPDFMRRLSDEHRAIQEGRSLVKRYNCNGCHVIEGQGGAIAAFYSDKAMAPPPLEVGALHQGEKVQATWLYQFLGRPTPLRPWLHVRMPTFDLPIEEATTLTSYFAALGGQRLPYEYVAIKDPPPENIRAGRLLMSKEYFDCFTCHQQGDKKPEGPPEGWAPDLALASRRLRPAWIARWLKDPQQIQPGTRMPAYYPGGPDDVLGGDDERQIQAITDYLMQLGKR